MLTKIGVAALLGTLGTAAVGGVARADEPCDEGFVPPPAMSVTVAAPAPVVTPVDYRYGWGWGGYDRDGYDRGYGRPGVYYRDDWRREHVERMRRGDDRRDWFHHHHRYYW